MEKLVSPCKFCKQKNREFCSKNCEALEIYCKKIGNPLEFRNMGIDYEEVYYLNLSKYQKL